MSRFAQEDPRKAHQSQEDALSQYELKDDAAHLQGGPADASMQDAQGSYARGAAAMDPSSGGYAEGAQRLSPRSSSGGEDADAETAKFQALMKKASARASSAENRLKKVSANGLSLPRTLTLGQYREARIASKTSNESFQAILGKAYVFNRATIETMLVEWEETLPAKDGEAPEVLKKTGTLVMMLPFIALRGIARGKMKWMQWANKMQKLVDTKDSFGELADTLMGFPGPLSYRGSWDDAKVATHKESKFFRLGKGPLRTMTEGDLDRSIKGITRMAEASAMFSVALLGGAVWAAPVSVVGKTIAAAQIAVNAADAVFHAADMQDAKKFTAVASLALNLSNSVNTIREGVNVKKFTDIAGAAEGVVGAAKDLAGLSGGSQQTDAVMQVLGALVSVAGSGGR